MIFFQKNTSSQRLFEEIINSLKMHFSGAEPSLEEAVAVATQELSLSATQESSTTEAGLIQSDDGKSPLEIV